MPTYARKDIMNPTEIESHHFWSRCVASTYLFGVDPHTGRDLSHRLNWLDSLIEHLASVTR